MKSSELEGAGGISFAGISDKQKVAAMQALNERDCECGCGMGHIAGCAKKDPNCPRSPKIAKQVVEMAKQGKTFLNQLQADYKESGADGVGAAPATGEEEKPMTAEDRRAAGKAMSKKLTGEKKEE
jgi:hypothetical protein